ncbi:hypothetical protein EGW08_015803 [Elysia chlorotica]|uniref:Mpv17-like protein 2 n=1 Tax=Elysia chlorotica TaxID=188477 RepID=A0A433T4G6_ELYCH|nr:hypothetical protein EGW08_015803 [Elysia chlorotica]
MHVLKRAALASQKLSIKVRPVVTSVRDGGKLLFSEKLLLYTNTGLSVAISIAGDVMQQNLKSFRLREGSGKKWDKTRTFHMAASGLAVGPVAHYWYLYLDRWFPGRNVASLFKKVALDQLVLSPVYVTMFLVVIGLLEGQSRISMKEEFKVTGVSMIVSDVVVWTPAQTFNFYFVPTRFRVLFDNCISFAMDMWYSYLRFDCHHLHSSSIKGSKTGCNSTGLNDSLHLDTNHAAIEPIDCTEYCQALLPTSSSQ